MSAGLAGVGEIGAVLGVVRDTVPVKPFTAATVTVVVPVWPVQKGMVVGLAEVLKSTTVMDRVTD